MSRLAGWTLRTLAGAAIGAAAGAPFAYYLEPVFLHFGAIVGGGIGTVLGLPVPSVRRAQGVPAGALVGLAAGWVVARLLADQGGGADEMRSLGLLIAGFWGGAGGLVLGTVIGPVLSRLDRKREPPEATPPDALR